MEPALLGEKRPILLNAAPIRVRWRSWLPGKRYPRIVIGHPSSFVGPPRRNQIIALRPMYLKVTWGDPDRPGHSRKLTRITAQHDPIPLGKPLSLTILLTD